MVHENGNTNDNKQDVSNSRYVIFFSFTCIVIYPESEKYLEKYLI